MRPGIALFLFIAVCHGFRSAYTTLQKFHNRAIADSETKRQFYEENKHRIKLANNAYYQELGRYEPQVEAQIKRENATLLMLVRNWELDGALASMRSLEDRLNKEFHYPWIFLNDVPFTEEFMNATSLMASGKTYYRQVPSCDWDMPEWINKTRFEANLANAEQQGVLYGSSRSYRNMCKFNSGYFYRQEILQSYDYYFRVEPNVEYFCDFQYDPFKLMREQNKKYGFVISLYEYENTIPTLWDVVEKFMAQYPEHLAKDNAFRFITDKSAIGDKTLMINSTNAYNLCHFWSNFEIGDLNFFRSKQYNDFFETLNNAGGFYYERWGDAPVHSLGVALLLNRSEVQHFEDIGYMHTPFLTCPGSNNLKHKKRCVCDDKSIDNIDLELHSCLNKWWKFGAGKEFLNYV